MVRILIAEDEELELLALQRIIAAHLPERAEVVALARTGTEAVAAARRMAPDIVLLDIRMPEMDGLTAAAIIRGEFPAARIAVLTAHGEFAYAQRALNLGACQYLLKPVAPPVLAELLERLCREVVAEHARGSGRAPADPRAAALLAADLLAPSPRLRERWPELAAAAGCADLPVQAVAVVDRQMGQWAAVAAALQAQLREFSPLVVPDGALPGGGSERVVLVGPAPSGVPAGDLTARLAGLVAWAHGRGWHWRVGLGTAVPPGQLARSAREACAAARWADARPEAPVCRYEGLSEGEANVARALWEMAVGYATDLTLEELARRVHVSPSHLSRLFTRYLGVGVHSYLTGVRLQVAHRLLREGAGTIEFVARQAGFHSHHYFCHVFKRHFGVAPGVYRGLALRQG